MFVGHTQPELQNIHGVLRYSFKPVDSGSHDSMC